MQDKLPEQIDSKFRFVLLAAHRAEQMMRGARPRVDEKTETVGGVTDVYTYTYDLADRLSEVRMSASRRNRTGACAS